MKNTIAIAFLLITGCSAGDDYSGTRSVVFSGTITSRNDIKAHLITTPVLALVTPDCTYRLSEDLSMRTTTTFRYTVVGLDDCGYYNALGAPTTTFTNGGFRIMRDGRDTIAFNVWIEPTSTAGGAAHGEQIQVSRGL